MAIMAVGAMAVFILSLAIWAREVDVSARVREESQLLQGVLARITEVEQVIAAEVDADDAVANLDLAFDSDWATGNLVAAFNQTTAFDAVVVVDGADRTIYSSRPPKDPSRPTRTLATARLVAEVRQAEAARGPLHARPVYADQAARFSAPIQRSAFVADHGQAWLVSASLVQPDRGVVLPSARAPIVLTSLPIDGAFLTLMAERYQLDGLKGAVGAPRGDDPARVSFDTAGNGPPLVLTWRPQRPGHALLERAFWPVLLVMLVFGAVGMVMLGAARRAAHGLLASNRAQTEFLANMSHEIRTPLNGVVGVADALVRTDLSPHQAELVEIIRSSGSTLERLLSDVLDLAKIETGSVAIELSPFNLADAVRASAALAGPRAQEKGVVLRVEMHPLAEATVLGDQVRMKQILTNLLSNAVKFTQEGSVVLTVTPAGAEDDWRFVVQDTGVGFDPSHTERLFGRFQQEDGSVTRRFGGTGLGLAICKQLTELMGGSIQADSRPGAGARFTVMLPLPGAEASLPTPLPALKSAPSPAAEPGAPDRMRVLLADDHPTNRRVIEVLLAVLEVDLVAVENGLEACEAFETGDFDAVLMDMQMPQMDGLTATRRIRAYEAERGLQPTFLVMLTANAMREHQEASLAAGADLHLPKPIEAQRLYAALARAGEVAARSRAA